MKVVVSLLEMMDSRIERCGGMFASLSTSMMRFLRLDLRGRDELFEEDVGKLIEFEEAS